MTDCKKVKTLAAEAAQAVLDQADDLDGAWGPNWLRFDPFGYLRNMGNPVFKFLSGIFADGVGISKGGGTTGQSAEEYAGRLRQRLQLGWFREIEAAFDQMDDGSWGREARLREWLRRVADEVELNTPTSALDESTARAVQATREYFNTYLKELKSSGVKYAQNLETLGEGTYIPHILNNTRFREVAQEIGEAKLVKLLKDSLLKNLSENPDLNSLLLQGSAPGFPDNAVHLVLQYAMEGYVRSVLRRGVVGNLAGIHGFHLGDTETLESLMKEAGVPATRRMELLAALGNMAPKGETGPARFKTRFNFDMQHVGEDGIAVKDLFDRDLINLTTLYGRQVAGHVGMAKVLGIKSRDEFERWLATAYDVDAGRTDPGAFQRALKLARYGYDAVTGMPLENDPGSAFSVWARRFRAYNYTVRMIKAGLAQVVELGRVVTATGLTAMTQQMPAFRQVLSFAKDGKLDNDLLRELEAWTGLGGHRTMSRYFTGLDENDIAIGSTSVDRALHRMSQLTSDVSGLSFTTSILQRMAAAGMSQRIANMALTGQVGVKELASLGLSEKAAKRMLENLKVHAEVGQGHRLHRLNLEKWDADSANDFTMAIYRASRRVVQENDYGNTFPFMHSTLGKLLTQFRSFMLGAFYKQTLHGAAMHDMTNLAGFLATSFLGALAYVVRVQLSEGDADKREQKLSTAKIAAGALNASGYSSIFPMATDTILRNVSNGTVGGVFSDARSSGLGSGIVSGIPLVSTADQLQHAVGALNALRPGYDFSQADAHAMASLIPFLNAYGIQRGLSAIISDLPKQSSTSEQIKPAELLFGTD